MPGTDGKARPPLDDSKPRSVLAEGRLATDRGSRIAVAAKCSGRLLRMDPAEGVTVRRGDVLAQIACDEVLAALAEAEARIAEVEAEYSFCTREELQLRQLYQANATADVNLLHSACDRQVAGAKRAAVKARAAHLRAQHDRWNIVAPIAEGPFPHRPRFRWLSAFLRTPVPG